MAPFWSIIVAAVAITGVMGSPVPRSVVRRGDVDGWTATTSSENWQPTATASVSWSDDGWKDFKSSTTSPSVSIVAVLTASATSSTATTTITPVLVPVITKSSPEFIDSTPEEELPPMQTIEPWPIEDDVPVPVEPPVTPPVVPVIPPIPPIIPIIPDPSSVLAGVNLIKNLEEGVEHATKWLWDLTQEDDGHRDNKKIEEAKKKVEEAKEKLNKAKKEEEHKNAEEKISSDKKLKEEHEQKEKQQAKEARLKKIEQEKLAKEAERDRIKKLEAKKNRQEKKLLEDAPAPSLKASPTPTTSSKSAQPTIHHNKGEASISFHGEHHHKFQLYGKDWARGKHDATKLHKSLESCGVKIKDWNFQYANDKKEIKKQDWTFYAQGEFNHKTLSNVLCLNKAIHAANGPEHLISVTSELDEDKSSPSASSSGKQNAAVSSTTTTPSAQLSFDGKKFTFFGKGFVKDEKSGRELQKKFGECSKTKEWKFYTQEKDHGMKLKEQGWDFYAEGSVKKVKKDCLNRVIQGLGGPVGVVQG
ncbi:hypothetical protein D6D02_05742 [Aureobasidium pullulans]|nr:hypothetical protein D6D02_05742 [Aureobasidium pullulans]THZ20668.1 hypothetical protein D6C89_07088 [Aureobasidium pullulans]